MSADVQAASDLFPIIPTFILYSSNLCM